MSRQSRGGPPGSGSTPPSFGNPRGESANSAGPAPMVQQQAQQYLEENVKAWMQPSGQAVNRELPPLPLPRTASPADSHCAYHPRPSTSGNSSGSNLITRQALEDHNLALQYPRATPPVPPHGIQNPQRVAANAPLTSPSSGYSDSYFATSLTDPSDQNVVGPSVSCKVSAFPHSLSFGGCSQHSLLQGTSYSTPCGNSPFGITQPSAAASFFARAAQRLNLSTRKKRKAQNSSESESPVFRTNFCEILKSHPPPIPPGLLRSTGRKDGTGIGKVKVMLRMCPSSEAGSADGFYMSVDSRKKQVTLYDPTVCGSEQASERHVGVAAPKMFAFDSVFSPDDNQAEVCSSSLCDVITSVVGGSDGCLFVYGHSKLGKSSTMVGSSASPQDLGVIPSAIWWLFRSINEHKHKTGARFSVRVSAVEVSGKSEELRDLLADYAAGTEGSGSAPGVYLRDDPVFGTQLMNQSELRAPTAERAAFLLDAALAQRTLDHDEEAKNAHFLFTLHVYQYRVDKGGRGGVAGGRSRLHLFDLGSCEKTTKSRDGGAGGCLSLSALGNVILALFNGQKHVPYKDSKLTQLLREAVGSVTCRAAMIAHVSTAPSRYPETLATLQLASRIHRLRRKKLKFPTTAEASSSIDDKGVCRPFVRIHAVGDDGAKSGSSDQDYTSSSEQSCDTVIFVGSGRGTPMPGSAIDRQSTPTVSPLATAGNNSVSQTGVSKKQSSKSSHNQVNQQKISAISSASNPSERRTIDLQAKSALNSTELKVNIAPGVTVSPKKKMPSTLVHSSPKHQKLDSHLSGGSGTPPLCMSPKTSKHSVPEHCTESRKGSFQLETSYKGSPVKTTKSGSVDQLKKSIVPASLSTPNSPQSPRKSKRSHKLEHGTGSSPHISQQPPQVLVKEPKRTSDETWIDGPRFVKPKFDSRTLHQLQKEKWVDGPGLYGYMDVQKETMIKKWVHDHSNYIPENEKPVRQEVWIDFPPQSDDSVKKVGTNRPVPASSDHADLKVRAGGSSTEESKKARTRTNLEPSNQVKVEVEMHHYENAKFDVSKERQEHVSKKHSEKNKCIDKHENVNTRQEEMDNRMELSNVTNENTLEEIYRYLESQTSDENSNSSVDLNENDSDDLSNKLKCVPENANSTFSCSSINDRTDNQTEEDLDYYSTDNIPMVDSCIQVTEEDIFMSCGWPPEVNNMPLSFRDADTFGNVEHPLRILSAEDLNLACSFTDSRAASECLDSISVPETWAGSTDDIDPDLTLKLLRGHSFVKSKGESDIPDNRNTNRSSFKITARSQTLSAKLERLSRLRELFEKKNDDKWKSLKLPEKISDLPYKENRLFFSGKLHHSADSSLEELTENDSNSIQSEPAELDVDKYDYHFNVKPMDGLRLEEFYNKICKVPRFPECMPHFGKPTQIVPPIVKQPKNYAKIAIGDLKSFKETLKRSKEKLKDESPRSPNSLKKRWSDSSRNSENGSEISKQPSVADVASTEICDTTTENSNLSDINSKLSNSVKSDSGHFNNNDTEQVKRRSLVEIIHEQRCQVYSERPQTPPHHHITKQTHRTAKSTKVITEKITNVVSNIEITELKNESFSHKRQVKKNGSPKLPHRTVTESRCSSGGRQMRMNQHSMAKTTQSSATSISASLSPRHMAKVAESYAQSMVTASASWTHSVDGNISSPYSVHPQCDDVDFATFKNNILSRSTSTPTSPFLTDEVQHSWTNVDYSANIGTPSYVYCTSSVTPTVTTLVTPTGNTSKKVSKWGIRTSSSGHGSDSSTISSDLKETKELLGCMPKSQQFSGTSSGYESMPRDSEGTPLSSSSHESCSEVGGKRETRGRKGTRKKSQGSGKRSRSVPARPPITSSASWQRLPIPAALQPMRARGRLNRDLNDPTLFKSEEDVCCTSLLCCRLLDFY